MLAAVCVRRSLPSSVPPGAMAQPVGPTGRPAPRLPPEGVPGYCHEWINKGTCRWEANRGRCLYKHPPEDKAVGREAYVRRFADAALANPGIGPSAAPRAPVRVPSALPGPLREDDARMQAAYNSEWKFGPIDAHPGVYPQKDHPNVCPNGMDPAGFYAGRVGIGAKGSIPPQLASDYGLEGFDPTRVTLIIHTGGVDDEKTGIPSHVEMENILYLGGTMFGKGWREMYHTRDQETAKREVVDHASGVRYNKQCDGFSGFVQRDLVEAMNGYRNLDRNQVGDELRRLLEDAKRIILRCAVKAGRRHNLKEPAVGHMGVLCRIGRHRSNGIADLLKAVCKHYGFNVWIQCHALFDDNRGPCGCHSGRCRAHLRDEPWLQANRIAKAKATSKFLQCTDALWPVEILRVRSACKHWIPRRYEPALQASVPVSSPPGETEVSPLATAKAEPAVPQVVKAVASFTASAELPKAPPPNLGPAPIPGEAEIPACAFRTPPPPPPIPFKAPAQPGPAPYAERLKDRWDQEAAVIALEREKQRAQKAAGMSLPGSGTSAAGAGSNVGGAGVDSEVVIWPGSDDVPADEVIRAFSGDKLVGEPRLQTLLAMEPYNAYNEAVVTALRIAYLCATPELLPLVIKDYVWGTLTKGSAVWERTCVNMSDEQRRQEIRRQKADATERAASQREVRRQREARQAQPASTDSSSGPSEAASTRAPVESPNTPSSTETPEPPVAGFWPQAVAAHEKFFIARHGKPPAASPAPKAWGEQADTGFSGLAYRASQPYAYKPEEGMSSIPEDTLVRPPPAKRSCPTPVKAPPSEAARPPARTRAATHSDAWVVTEADVAKAAAVAARSAAPPPPMPSGFASAWDEAPVPQVCVEAPLPMPKPPPPPWKAPPPGGPAAQAMGDGGIYDLDWTEASLRASARGVDTGALGAAPPAGKRAKLAKPLPPRPPKPAPTPILLSPSAGTGGAWVVSAEEAPWVAGAESAPGALDFGAGLAQAEAKKTVPVAPQAAAAAAAGTPRVLARGTLGRHPRSSEDYEAELRAQFSAEAALGMFGKFHHPSDLTPASTPGATPAGPGQTPIAWMSRDRDPAGALPPAPPWHRQPGFLASETLEAGQSPIVGAPAPATGGTKTPTFSDHPERAVSPDASAAAAAAEPAAAAAGAATGKEEEEEPTPSMLADEDDAGDGGESFISLTDLPLTNLGLTESDAADLKQEEECVRKHLGRCRRLLKTLLASRGFQVACLGGLMCSGYNFPSHLALTDGKAEPSTADGATGAGSSVGGAGPAPGELERCVLQIEFLEKRLQAMEVDGKFPGGGPNLEMIAHDYETLASVLELGCASLVQGISDGRSTDQDGRVLESAETLKETAREAATGLRSQIQEISLRQLADAEAADAAEAAGDETASGPPSRVEVVLKARLADLVAPPARPRVEPTASVQLDLQGTAWMADEWQHLSRKTMDLLPNFRDAAIARVVDPHGQGTDWLYETPQAARFARDEYPPVLSAADRIALVAFANRVVKGFKYYCYNAHRAFGGYDVWTEGSEHCDHLKALNTFIADADGYDPGPALGFSLFNLGGPTDDKGTRFFDDAATVFNAVENPERQCHVHGVIGLRRSDAEELGARLLISLGIKEVRSGVVCGFAGDHQEDWSVWIDMPTGFSAVRFTRALESMSIKVKSRASCDRIPPHPQQLSVTRTASTADRELAAELLSSTCKPALRPAAAYGGREGDGASGAGSSAAGAEHPSGPAREVRGRGDSRFLQGADQPLEDFGGGEPTELSFVDYHGSLFDMEREYRRARGRDAYDAWWMDWETRRCNKPKDKSWVPHAERITLERAEGARTHTRAIVDLIASLQRVGAASLKESTSLAAQMHGARRDLRLIQAVEGDDVRERFRKRAMLRLAPKHAAFMKAGLSQREATRKVRNYLRSIMYRAEQIGWLPDAPPGTGYHDPDPESRRTRNDGRNPTRVSSDLTTGQRRDKKHGRKVALFLQGHVLRVLVGLERDDFLTEEDKEEVLARMTSTRKLDALLKSHWSHMSVDRRARLTVERDRIESGLNRNLGPEAGCAEPSRRLKDHAESLMRKEQHGQRSSTGSATGAGSNARGAAPDGDVAMDDPPSRGGPEAPSPSSSPPDEESDGGGLFCEDLGGASSAPAGPPATSSAGAGQPAMSMKDFVAVTPAVELAKAGPPTPGVSRPALLSPRADAVKRDRGTASQATDSEAESQGDASGAESDDEVLVNLKHPKRRARRSKRKLPKRGGHLVPRRRPFHLCARELYGLRDPRLPSPYAQDSALQPFDSAAGLWIVPLYTAAEAVACAAWQVGPSRALAAVATWKAAELINEGSLEVAIGTHVLAGVITEESVALTKEMAFWCTWVFRGVLLLFLARVLRWGSDELGLAWATLWGYRDHRRPTPYAQAAREEPASKPSSGAAGAGSSVGGAAAGSRSSSGAEIARNARARAKAKAAVSPYPVDPYPGPPMADDAIADLAQRFSAVNLDSDGHGQHAYEQAPGPPEYLGRYFPREIAECVGVRFTFTYPRGDREFLPRQVRITSVDRGGDFYQHKVHTHDFGAKGPSQSRTYFEHLCTDIWVHARHGGVTQDSPRWFRGGPAALPYGGASVRAASVPEEATPRLVPEAQASASGAGSSAAGAAGSVDEDFVEVTGGTTVTQPPLSLILHEPAMLPLIDDGIVRKAIALALKSAKSITCSWYTLDDFDLCEAFNSKAAQIPVRLVLDRGQYVGSSSAMEPARVLEALGKGVQVRLGSSRNGRATVHQKTMLIDEGIALLGSGNATKHSRNSCYEFGIMTQDPDVVSSLSKRLEMLWEEGTAVTMSYATEIRDKHASRREAKSEAKGARPLTAAEKRDMSKYC